MTFPHFWRLHSCIENTGKVNHDWHTLSLSSGRRSSLPTPSGHPACLPDEEVLAPRWNGWTPGVGTDSSPPRVKIMPSLCVVTQSYVLPGHQSCSQPAVSAAAAVPRRAADGASRAGLAAVPRRQHGLCPHFADVHGKTPGVGRRW